MLRNCIYPKGYWNKSTFKQLVYCPLVAQLHLPERVLKLFRNQAPCRGDGCCATAFTRKGIETKGKFYAPQLPYGCATAFTRKGIETFQNLESMQKHEKVAQLHLPERVLKPSVIYATCLKYWSLRNYIYPKGYWNLCQFSSKKPAWTRLRNYIYPKGYWNFKSLLIFFKSYLLRNCIYPKGYWNHRVISYYFIYFWLRNCIYPKGYWNAEICAAASAVGWLRNCIYPKGYWNTVRRSFSLWVISNCATTFARKIPKPPIVVPVSLSDLFRHYFKRKTDFGGSLCESTHSLTSQNRMRKRRRQPLQSPLFSHINSLCNWRRYGLPFYTSPLLSISVNAGYEPVIENPKHPPRLSPQSYRSIAQQTWLTSSVECDANRIVFLFSLGANKIFLSPASPSLSHPINGSSKTRKDGYSMMACAKLLNRYCSDVRLNVTICTPRMFVGHIKNMLAGGIDWTVPSTSQIRQNFR